MDLSHSHSHYLCEYPRLGYDIKQNERATERGDGQGHVGLPKPFRVQAPVGLESVAEFSQRIHLWVRIA